MVLYHLHFTLTVAISVSNSHLQHIKKTSENNTVTKEELIKTLCPGASEIMINLLTIQINICESSKDARGRRWTKDIIQVALTFWNSSPQAYASLKRSGMIFVPSENLLQRYKNCFERHPGLNDNMFIWMFNESKRLNVDKHGVSLLMRWQPKRT